MFRCSDGSYHVGHTNDLEHRLAAHERGAVEGYTLSRRPVELVFSDQFSTRLEAFHRERQIKGDWDGLVELSNRSSGHRLRMEGKRLRLGVRSFDRLRMMVGGTVLRQAQDEG